MVLSHSRLLPPLDTHHVHRLRLTLNCRSPPLSRRRGGRGGGGERGGGSTFLTRTVVAPASFTIGRKVIGAVFTSKSWFSTPSKKLVFFFDGRTPSWPRHLRALHGTSVAKCHMCCCKWPELATIQKTTANWHSSSHSFQNYDASLSTPIV